MNPLAPPTIRWLVPLLVVSAVAAGACGSVAGTVELPVRAGEPEAARRLLQIASFNAHILPAPGVKDRALRAGEIGREFESFDIVGLSEVFGGELGQDAIKEDAVDSLRALGFFVTSEPTGGQRKRLVDSGLILASRFPIRSSVLVRFDRCFQFDCLASKGVLLAELVLDGDLTLNIALTHLQAFELNGSRMAQVREMVQQIASRFDPEAPLLVMGDLNIRGGLAAAQNGSSQYSRLRQMLGDAIDTVGMTSGFDIPTNGRKRIDYIFCRHCEQLGELQFAGTKAPVYSSAGTLTAFSDHRALVVAFRRIP